MSRPHPPLAPPRRLLPGLLLALALLAPGCKRAAPPPLSPQCRKLVDTIRKCDPTAAGASRSTLASGCAARLECTKIDTSTKAGCRQFMGCLYGG